MKDLFRRFLLFFILHKKIATSINITDISVSSPAVVGERGMLNCEWILENEMLYSLKWYQGIREFYTWTPGAETQKKIFPVKGLSIDTSRSSGGYIEFITTSIDATNKYKCEVTADAPIFDTDISVIEMTVVDLPEMHPMLILDQISYKIYDNVTVGCSSQKAYPEPKLNFFLNGDAIDSNQVLQATYKDIKSGLNTTEANHTFTLKPYMIIDGKLQIKCTAEIDEVYWGVSEIELPANHAPYAHQSSNASRNQINLIISQMFLLLQLVLQAALFVFNT